MIKNLPKYVKRYLNQDSNLTIIKSKIRVNLQVQ